MQTDTTLTNQLLVEDIGQKDEVSAYPAALLLFDYPTKFYDLKPFKQKEFDYYYSRSDKYAMIIEVSWKNIELNNPDATPVPYISVSKCSELAFNSSEREKKALEVDNGRVISAYSANGEFCNHHEVSRFVREPDGWKFADGELVGEKPVVREEPKIGRNDPCPCGSGKKYKKCCGRDKKD